MEMCARCKKRPASVFITKVENGVQKQEGLCLVCAKELKIGPVDEIMKKFNIAPEELQNMEDMMTQMMGESEDGDPDEEQDDSTIDFNKLMKNAGGPFADKETVAQKHIKDKRKNLNLFCHDLTKQAKDGKLDQIVGRERELERVIQILCRRQKNNPCLIGEPGVGKTAVAEALAQKIAKGEVPYKLQNHEVFLLDLTSLVAGTQFRGQFEARINALIKEIKLAGNIILFIDEIHNIIGTGGNTEGSMNAANILKPALSRGEIQVIGATTMTEYRKYIEKDTALERRFQPVKVDEPSIDECVQMILGIKHYYEVYHGVKISPEIAKEAVVMSERYITDRFLPDKAIDMIDEACAHIVLHSENINERYALMDELGKVDKETEEINQKIENATENNDSDYQKLAELKAKKSQLLQKKEKLDVSCQNIVMTKEDLADVIEVWTGIPASTISQDEFERLGELENKLKERIVGQDKAVCALANAIRRNRVGIGAKHRPVSFIFAGPTGVGKTELVKTLASQLFNSVDSLIRLDMSEFMEKHSVSKIIGAPPGYVGYDEAGQLTEKIRRRPYSVILFDEIEKAHPDVLNILLQILDDGRVQDSQGRMINFENTVIVMTTNAGSNFTSSTVGFYSKDEILDQQKTEKALLSFLRPEFVNRVDEVITFNALTEEDFVKIAKIMLEDLKNSLAERDIDFTYENDVCALVAKNSYSKKFGARNMRRYLQKEVEDKIAGIIVLENKGKVKAVTVSVKENQLNFLCQ